jgi:cephalosporin hydroxylase
MRLFGSKKKQQESFSLDGIYHGHLKMTYRGVRCIKCPFDYVLYQMIIDEIKPDMIIEIGTHHGGSAYYLGDLLNIIGHGVIHSIDIEDRVPEIVKQHPRIKLFFDGWENYDLSLVKGERILVIEDSSHEYKNTLGAINRFCHLVTPGSYLIVEDGIIEDLNMTEEYFGGPVKAIKEFLPQHPEFILDEKWHDFFGKAATFNTMGYLKRIS